MTVPHPKFVEKDFHKEVYVNFGDYFVIVSDQKFLIMRIKDEGVTEMMILVQNLVALLGNYYVDYMDIFSIAAPFPVTVVYQKEVSMPVLEAEEIYISQERILLGDISSNKSYRSRRVLVQRDLPPVAFCVRVAGSTRE